MSSCGSCRGLRRALQQTDLSHIGSVLCTVSTLAEQQCSMLLFVGFIQVFVQRGICLPAYVAKGWY